ncbi:FlgO family outer membrane protein [Bowmanella denitrificans]|uniref:FlgO family outer membrane protein n=1 Tax=Bowmanella denitrificans TaxID=366582 RepID=UPI0011AFC372|nr:FlgO family outer membrane protein [Bowmanella denitrificans]
MRSCLFIAVLAASGCQMMEGMPPQAEQSKSVENFQPATFSTHRLPSSQETVHDHVRLLMNDMAMTMRDVNENTTIVVADFVFVDGHYDKSELLGKQISQSFISELHQFGIKVLDYKMTDYIRVTAEGDLVLSRDYKELNPNVQAQYVLAGTLTKHRQGVLVQARIVNMSGKDVVAAGQTLIPAAQINALLPSQTANDML